MTAVTIADPTSSASLLRRARFIHGPWADLGVALLWVPFAVAAHLLEGSQSSLRTLMGATFVLSFAHQPLTTGLVYGDPAQRALHRRIYAWSPVVFAAAIVIGLNVSLALVALVAGLWNAEHTLMQRYGLTRIYGRKVGDDQGGIEKPMLVSWLVLTLVWAAAFVNIGSLADRIGLGATNRTALDQLERLQPVARVIIVPVVVGVAVLAWRWLQAERSLGSSANPAKHLYLASTAALFLVMMIDPLAGFVAYVGSHAVEYFVIVQRSLRVRSQGPNPDPSPVARLTRTRARRVLVGAGYLAAIVWFALVSTSWFDGQLFRFTLLLLGGMHVFYDGFIWKLRRPAVAAPLGVPAPA